MVLKYYLLMLLLVLTLLNDLMTQKIKNAIVLPFFLLGLILNSYLAGLPGIIDSLLASLAPILLLGIFFCLKMLGAGDIKLFSAIGALMGVNFVLKAIVYSSLTGGVIALFILAFRHNAKERWAYFCTYLRYCFWTHSLPPYSNSVGIYDNSKFPYAYAITTGTLLIMLLR